MTWVAFLLVASLATLVYIYLGYPLIVRILGLWRPRPVAVSDGEPMVSILTSAYNEAVSIEATVRNKLELDYPADRLEILVVSDDSEDGTDAIVDAIARLDSRVTLLRQQPRAGKTSALNLAVEHAVGDVLVFADANSMYAPDALRHLVAPFADPGVGYVTGRMVYRASDGSLTGEGCSAYMRYENVLRRWETCLGSVVGVDGGIDAVRRENYVRMKADQQPDFVLPLSVVEQGKRVVHAPGALLYEEALENSADEFQMRIRVSLRAWNALRDKSALFDVRRFGLFSWQLFSHKVLRYLAPVFQILALAANVALAGQGAPWTQLMTLHGLFYAAALLGAVTGGKRLPAIIVFPYYLCLLNAAAGVALIRFLKGENLVVWQPRT